MKYNREQFVNFMKFLDSRAPFGTITFHMVSTSRKWFKTRLEEKKLIDPIEVKNTFDDDTIRAFEICLAEWDHRQSWVERELIGVPKIFDEFTKKLRENMGFLGEETIRGIHDLGNELRELNERAKQQEIIKIVVQREMVTKNSISLLNHEIKNFNEMVSIVQAAGTDAKTEQLKELETMRLRLRTKIEKAIQMLDELRTKLKNEVLEKQFPEEIESF